MKIIKRIDFTDKEKESLETVLSIWADYRCREDDGLCEDCVWRGFCLNRGVIDLTGIEAVKDNLTDRI